MLIPSASPRFSAPRRPDRRTLGPVAGKISKALGKPFLPWQQQAADVALEVDPRTGRLVYDDVRVTVPRQSGKTTLLLPIILTRWQASTWLGGPQTMLYFAQNRIKARRKWENTFVRDLKGYKPIQGMYDVKLSTGDEHVRFDDDSIYLWNKVETGRIAVAQGSTGKICYIEYSAEQDLDPEDYGNEDVWYSCMPALGHTIPIDAVQSAFGKMERPEFARAYLNIWPDEVINTKIPRGGGRGWADPASSIAGQPVLAVDVSWDRSTACIVAAGRSATDPDRGALEVVDIRPGMGTRWVGPRLGQLLPPPHAR